MGQELDGLLMGALGGGGGLLLARIKAEDDSCPCLGVATRELTLLASKRQPVRHTGIKLDSVILACMETADGSARGGILGIGAVLDDLVLNR